MNRLVVDRVRASLEAARAAGQIEAAAMLHREWLDCIDAMWRAVERAERTARASYAQDASRLYYEVNT